MITIASCFKATLYFKQEHFKTAIPVSITAILVMFTLNHSIALKLPATSEFKFIDLWIISGLLLHFTILILLILNEHLPEKPNIVLVEENNGKYQHSYYQGSPQERTRNFSRNILPYLELSFVVLYFLIAFFILFNN